MSLLMELGTGQGYLKAGLLGFNKSGKSYTGTLLAIAAARATGADGPIVMFDTEGGSEYLAPLVLRLTGKKLLGVKSRSFDDLMKVTLEAEEVGGALVIDSITHVWRELTEAYKKKRNKGTLDIRDIMAIKDIWAAWPDLYLNSQLHVCICGRAGYEWDMEENENGRKQLVKTGVKMKVESEFGFEPSLLIEMERVQEEVGGGKYRLTRQAIVLGDRFNKIDAHSCRFESCPEEPEKELAAVAAFFGPHLACLTPGAHTPINTSVSSDPPVDEEGPEWQREKRSRTILCEEIMGELTRAFPGQTSREKYAKGVLVKQAFGTFSWTHVEQLHSNQLKTGLEKIRGILNNPIELESLLNPDHAGTAV